MAQTFPLSVSDVVPQREVTGAIERVISEVPPPRTHRESEPGGAAEQIAHAAARSAALVSTSLALPPGPLGMLTVLPDLYMIWKIQRQMVSDIFALYGRTAELTRTHMLYCLFRHLASQVVRDVLVRAGERAIVQQLSATALSRAASALGLTIVKRVAGSAAGRWVPLAGAVAVGAYAYWDTLQVAKTARKLLEATQGAKPAD